METNDDFNRIIEMNTEAEKRRTIIKTHQDFIDKSFEVHSNRYSYPELYSGNNIKMRIICSIHGEFFQTPKKHIYDKQGCPKCAKNKRYTNAEFINRASQKHNNKYDYSLTEYVNMHTKVKIICPKHGIFQQTPDCHLKGIGCPMCKIEASKKEIYGVATNDLLYCCNSKSYKIWKSMIGRCFNKDIKNRHKSYKECDCCKDWLLFSNFKRWYDAQPHAYEDGYELDKDIFSEDKGFYSPQTCCLIPERLNIILVYRTASPNGLPRGIAKPANRYSVRTPSFIGDTSYKWMGTYDTLEEAMLVRDNVRLKQAADFALECFKNNKIDKRIFIGLLYKLKNIYSHGKDAVAYADALIAELNKKKTMTI